MTWVEWAIIAIAVVVVGPYVFAGLIVALAIVEALAKVAFDAARLLSKATITRKEKP